MGVRRRVFELLHADDRAGDFLFFAQSQDALHHFRRLHLQESEAARAAPQSECPGVLARLLLADRRMCHEHAHDMAIGGKVLLQRAGRLEAQLIDAAHNQEAVRVFVREQTQARRQSLAAFCFVFFHSKRLSMVLFWRCLLQVRRHKRLLFLALLLPLLWNAHNAWRDWSEISWRVRPANVGEVLGNLQSRRRNNLHSRKAVPTLVGGSGRKARDGGGEGRWTGEAEQRHLG
mmetsp:Transcript_111920/g.321533  ORF Transcript_111920/g.321533 Transcript_111920/m.321533 type:complete len:232 (-) Transcript_111920:253-948(-)